MSAEAASAKSPVSGVVAGVLIAVGLASFVAVFALIGWSPDLANKDRAGQHPYSSSALGYAGLTTLLKADGHNVSVSRLSASLDYSDGLLVLTLPPFGLNRAKDLDPYMLSEPALIILPKWVGITDREKPSWQADSSLMDKSRVEDLIGLFDEDAAIWRLRDPGRLNTPFGSARPEFEHSMQVIESDSLESVIETPGGDLMVKLPGRDIYILSDPDLANTFGLARRENARLMLGMARWLKPWDEAPIAIDATIHGFERSENLLKSIFDIPFIGATLLAFATAGLIGWAAFVRFGPPVRETRTLAFGKKALVDNSAGLYAMAQRETKMAPGYLNLSRRALVRTLGLPRTISDAELARTLSAIAKQNDIENGWEETSTPLAAEPATKDELKDKARALWRWRKEMTHGN